MTFLTVIKNRFSSKNSALVFFEQTWISVSDMNGLWEHRHVTSLCHLLFQHRYEDHCGPVSCIPVKKKNPGRFSHLVPDQQSEIHVESAAQTHFINNTSKVHTKEQLERVSSQSQFQLISSRAEGGSERRRRAGPGLLVALGCQR